MTSDHDAADSVRSRFGGRRGVFLIAGIGVLGLWAVALVSLGGQVNEGTDARSSSGITPQVTALTAPVAFEAPIRRVVLPAGAAQVNEYPTSFPHSPEGAAAAAVALTRYSASLDYQVVDEVLRLYAATGAAAAEAADGAAAAAVSAGRARLGLAMSGPAPMDSSVFAEPFAVRWVAKGADKVVVSVLAAVEYRSAQKQTRELVAATTLWKWDATLQDWRVTPGEAGTTPPTAEIGSTEFNEVGWTALAERRP